MVGVHVHGVIAEMAGETSVADAVARFLIHEASLLDDCRWGDWQRLFTAEGTYWMPADPSQSSPVEEVSLIYDNATLRELRCRRLSNADPVSSLSLQPFPRILRFLSNVRHEHAESGHVRGYANLIAAQYAASETRTFYARVQWDLLATGTEFHIRQKRVDLINAGGQLPDILIYL